jgi:hypothetical protein
MNKIDEMLDEMYQAKKGKKLKSVRSAKKRQKFIDKYEHVAKENLEMRRCYAPGKWVHTGGAFRYMVVSSFVNADRGLALDFVVTNKAGTVVKKDKDLWPDGVFHT